jgi:putative acetyltransferase
MIIRVEEDHDVGKMREITKSAFAGAQYSSQAEAEIIDELREADALTISLVADDGGEVIGHVAFSPVQIGEASGDWFGLGPIAVRPDRQCNGVGSSLIRAGLSRLAQLGARGCVVLGEPTFYGRFGFEHDARSW